MIFTGKILNNKKNCGVIIFEKQITENLRLCKIFDHEIKLKIKTCNFRFITNGLFSYVFIELIVGKLHTLELCNFAI